MGAWVCSLLSLLKITASCFPESAQVMALVNGAMRATAIAKVAVGDQVLSLDADGTLVLSTVYYIPHDLRTPPASARVSRTFLRVVHERCHRHAKLSLHVRSHVAIGSRRFVLSD